MKIRENTMSLNNAYNFVTVLNNVIIEEYHSCVIENGVMITVNNKSNNLLMRN